MKQDNNTKGKWDFVNERFIPYDLTDDAKTLFQSLNPSDAKTPEEKVDRKYASSLRLLMDRFTKTQAQKPEGTSYLSAQGIYLFGHNVGDRKKMLLRRGFEVAKRQEIENAYAKATAYGVSKALKESGFIKNKDNDYQDVDQMYLAIELDSISKKGPFDGGSEDIALEVADNLLGSASSPKEMDDITFALFEDEKQKRAAELKKIINPDFDPRPEDYLAMLAKKGLRNTHRGAWSHSAGENAVNFNTICKYKKELSGLHPEFESFFKGIEYDTPESYESWLSDRLASVIKLFDYDRVREEKQVEVRVKYNKKREPMNVPIDCAILKAPDYDYYLSTNIVEYDKYTKWGVQWDHKHYTHNYLLYDLLNVMYKANINLSEYINLAMCMVVPISRDQGAPFNIKVEMEGNDVVLVATDRKGRKYRIVIPAPALVQAYIQLYSADLIDNIKNARGRIGISTPDINIQRMNDMIHTNNQLRGYIESIDYETYDYTVTSQEMVSECYMLHELYHSERVKDAFKVAAFAMSHKCVLLPSFLEEGGHNYDKFYNQDATNVKGDPRYLRKRLLRGLPKDKQKEFLDELDSSFQYKTKWFYIYLSWLISGIILTNTIGSENTILIGRTFIRTLEVHPFFDKWLTVEDRANIKTWRQQYENETSEVVGNGDDCALTLPTFLLEKYGRAYVLEMVEQGFKELFGKIVKKDKQIKITYKGYPVVEMLQHIYIQGDYPEVNGTLTPYLKFLRQWGGSPYTERHSKRPLIQRYDSIEGRFDSCLCKQNVDFAAKCIYYTGERLKALYRKKGWYPEIIRGDTSDGFLYDPKFHPRNSSLAGLEQYFGFKKEYRNQFIPELTKLSVEVIMNGPEEYDEKILKVREFVDEYRDELETRAPHREYLERIGFAQIDSGLKEVLGIQSTKDEYSGFSSLTVDLVDSIEKQFGIVIPPLALPSGTKNKVFGVNIDDGPNADGLE